MPNTSVPDHYAVLGVLPSVAGEAIRLAYRRQALIAHPDKGGSEQAFHAVAEAFEVLSSPTRRAAYDSELRGAAGGPAAGPRTRKERALSRLATAVAALAREQRRAAIDALPRHVSEALLDWMQTGSGEPVALVKQRGGCKEAQKRRRHQRRDDTGQTRPGLLAPSLKEALASASTASPGVSSAASLEPQPTPQKRVPNLAPTAAVVETPSQQALVPAITERESGRPRSGGCRGVHKAGSKSNLYQASICCLNLVITSRTVADLDQALTFYSVLVLIRNDVNESMPNSGAKSLAIEFALQKLNASIEAACVAVGLCRRDLNLSFRPVISAIAEVGRQIHGQSSTELLAALRQRSELLLAKETGWPALRIAWIKLLKETKTEVAATSFVDTARRVHEQQHKRVRRATDNSGGAEPKARELQLAAQEVQQALDSEVRQASASARARLKAERREHVEQEQRRKMRRQWAEDPRRTTAELLAGPPMETCCT